MHQKANEVLNERNSKKYEFKTSGKDIDHIINLDVKQLREGLVKGTFTSVDLVSIFGQRSYQIGRALNLSAEENFQQALKLAAQRDAELEEAKR